MREFSSENSVYDFIYSKSFYFLFSVHRSGRRALSSFGTSGTKNMNEPLIVVEESGGIAEEEEDDESKPSSTDESPSNQFLLTPWRDMRKRSLPTPPCTSGITASQVNIIFIFPEQYLICP